MRRKIAVILVLLLGGCTWAICAHGWYPFEPRLALEPPFFIWFTVAVVGSILVFVPLRSFRVGVRRVILVVLCVCAAETLVLGVMSTFGGRYGDGRTVPVVAWGAVGGGPDVSYTGLVHSFRLRFGGGRLSGTLVVRADPAGISREAYSRGGSSFFLAQLFPYDGEHVSVYVTVPFWLPLCLLVAYPAKAFVSGPLRRYRRRKRDQCVHCGYSLVGLPEARCPECGREAG